MRIAIAGAHRTGKTTLLHALGEALPHYRVYEEPYVLLEEEGHEEPDFGMQLRHSLDLVVDAPADALFDRSPLDFVAYLGITEGDSFEVDYFREAMTALDLVVLVPIEHPDRITVGASEDRKLRSAVDEVLATMVGEDSYELGLEVIEVHGDVDARVKQVLARIK